MSGGFFYFSGGFYLPKTKFQSIVFTLMTAFCMVYLMTVYTVSKESGGLSYSVFFIALKGMWLEYAVVFLLVFFLITHFAQKLALRIVNPETDKPIFIILAIQFFTVCQIVPLITLFATFIHGGFTSDWFTNWISLAVMCFPMALCLQLFFVGPLVRFLFRTVFKKQLVE